MVLEALAEAIEGVVIHPDASVLAGALGLRGRLDAKRDGGAPLRAPLR